ncbi:DUF4442 domain-containing protein [Streptomyces sp. NPDC006476]|uniref:PaaI family thioesterase n=1 Tax=Streptomyces sp. NPDC006476 TaxID=3157175 RepID=UPI0033A4AF31
MDRTALARALLEPIPAHRTAGIEVVRAADAAAEVALRTSPELANVIGSLHSGGLVALIDATGLAAIIAAGGADGEMEGVVPLGRSASVEFLAPARGRLLASCRLTDEARDALRPLWTRETDRVRLSTEVEVVDASGALVCRGSFDWSVRRR